MRQRTNNFCCVVQWQCALLQLITSNGTASQTDCCSTEANGSLALLAIRVLFFVLGPCRHLWLLLRLVVLLLLLRS